jgi:hypothetical protein
MFYWIRRKTRLAFSFPVLAFTTIVVSSCNQGTDTTKLYNIDSLVNQQVQRLAVAKPKLQKHAFLGNKSDTLSYVPDSAAWSRELEIFRQLEAMNKPVNRSNYLVDDNLYDPGSNLTVKAFTALEPLPVRSVRVFYDTDIQKPRKIEAIYDEENTLYKSSKNLVLEFQQIDNKNLLTSYSIDGGQKMILSDSVTFSVKGRIQF